MPRTGRVPERAAPKMRVDGLSARPIQFHLGRKIRPFYGVKRFPPIVRAKPMIGWKGKSRVFSA
jgi:hypothetical protein